MAEIIDGKQLAKDIRAKVTDRVADIKEQYGKVPHLVVILVGDNPASQSYVKRKKRDCERAGMKSTIIHKDTDITEKELIDLVQRLNDDNDVHGLLVQLPLPDHINENIVINTIRKDKDVDGFHPLNIAAIHTGEHGIVPATPKGVMTMLKSAGIDLVGQEAFVIGCSNIAGKPIAMLLLEEKATVTIAHSKTRDLKKHAKEADIIVAAAGVPNLVTPDMVKEGVVVIDVGINRVEGKLIGDVDFEGLKDKASYITPVPGGVGPMTIASLLENTLECFEILEGKR